MSGWRDRTAEEREAARRERERRRAERDGRARPEPAPIPSAAPASTPAASSPAVPAPISGGPDPDEPEQDDAFDGSDHEVPVGTKRVPRRQRLQQSQAPITRPRGSLRTATRGPLRTASRGPLRTASRRPRRRISRAGRTVSLVALVLAGAAIWFLYELFQPFHGSGHGRVTVTVPAHSGAGKIGDLLERDGVISSSFFFGLRATLAGDRSDLRSGTYHLKLGMSYGDVLTALTTAPKPAKVSDLTIVEGRTRRQIDALLRSQHVRGSYLGATRHSRLLNPRAYAAPRSTPSLEGFLFPSTYQLRDPISIGALVSDQLNTFRKEFRSVSLSYARHTHLTPYDVLKIASMVQAEAQTQRDRPLVASVIYNRLHDQMPLQIDATTRYATGNYSRPLTVSQLNSRSPYNTRIHKGLPPTPIDNPGLASIKAAARPARTNYLYFVVKPCGNGEHVFSSSYAQFLKDAAKYQTARTQRGGRSPSHC